MERVDARTAGIHRRLGAGDGCRANPENARPPSPSCNVLRDNGLSTIEYVEQLSFLLFLKMADELATDPFAEETAAPIVPSELDWQSLASKRGEELEVHYRKVLTERGRHPGTTLGTVFAKAQNRITEPALLEKLVVELIGKTDWVLEGTDLKGDAYEGFLPRELRTPRLALASTSRRGP
ncbi:type I restriction-modification system subunit M N-terminal domain-containing protein [Streptomyces sp. NPDC085529]|uniref:type I restriction-modification system subunit M N-terminal domain-containing protein n=1 Tax=Streptomyces sp. NPDC085529 TaxID=3365729 RepID=UPI0037D62647